MATVTLTAQLKGFEAVGKALEGTASRLKRVGLTAENVSKKLTAAGGAMTAFGKKATTFVTLPLAGAGVAAVKFASDLDESMNKATVTFGQSAQVVTKFAETSAQSFGIAQADALEYSATLGVILQGSGFAADAAAGMSAEMVQLAADLASFNNIPIDEALQKIRSGLVGEAEPLRSVGVLLSEAAVQTKALELGLVKTKDEITDQIKVQARYAIIMEQTKTAQGDFARTSDSLANQMRILRASMVDAGAQIGQVMLPVALKMVSVVVEMVKRFGALDERTQKIIVVVAGLAAAIGPLAVGLGAVVAGFGTLLPILTTVVPVLAAIAAGVIGGAMAAQGLVGAFEGVKQALGDFGRKEGPEAAIALNKIAIGWLKVKKFLAGATGDTDAVVALTNEIDSLARSNFELQKMAEQADQSGQSTADSFLEGFQRGQGKIQQGFRDVADIAKTELANLANSVVDFVLPATEDAAGAVAESTEGATIQIAQLGATAAPEFDRVSEAAERAAESINSSLDDSLEQASEGLEAWVEESAITLATWGELAQSTFDQFKQGVGDAVATAIVEGENLAASMQNVLKNVAKSVISALVQIAIQQLVNLAISLLASGAQASAEGAKSIALAGSNAYASTAAIPIIGPALAPAAATAAIAGATAAFQAGAAAGKAQGATIGAAAGGMENVPETGTFLLHRGEAVLQREQNQDLRDFLARGGVTGDSVNITFAGPVNFADAIQKKKTIKDLERGLMRAHRRRAV